jgi:hypothetical protein
MIISPNLLASVAQLDTQIDGYRKYLKQVGSSGENSALDQEFAFGFTMIVSMMQTEANRVAKIVRKVNYLNKKKAG